MGEHAEWCIEPDCTNPVWITPTQHRSYCRAHQIKRSQDGYYAKHGGNRNRKIDKMGYVWVRAPDGQMRHEHKVVMEAKLGRALLPGESVHHKNGDRADNKRGNLELWVGGIRYGQRAKDIVCPHCGASYALKPANRAL